jgi:hypothetical protein
LSYIGSYTIPVVHRQNKERDNGLILPAERDDMSNSHLSFNWTGVWQSTWFGWEGIVKCVYQGSVKGLMQYAIQPTAEPEDEHFNPRKQAGLVEIVYLETIQDIEERLIDPVGYWLIWYAVQIGFKYCTGSNNGSILGLSAKPEACDYYKNKVRMEYGNFTASTPTTVTTKPFRFTNHDANSYCERLYAKYGKPQQQ